jgi:hypothetical protein
MATGERLVSESDAYPPTVLPLASLLAICDRALGEIGRRRHMFAWLRDPEAGFGQWLPVDAYYPGNRVVVVSIGTAAGHEQLYSELIPAHGFKLLTLDAAELGGDPAAAKAALQRMIASLELPERRVGIEDHTPPRENPVGKAIQSLVTPPAPQPPVRRAPPPSQAAAAERGARFADAHKADLARAQRSIEASRPHVPARPPAPTRPQPAPRGAWRPTEPAPPKAGARAATRSAIAPLDALGLLMGSVLFAALCGEVYLAVAVTWLHGAGGLLGFGILLDACSRLLGTIAAGRVGSRGWAWACLIGGTPVVVWFAFFQRSGPVLRAPAPLAGLFGLAALAVAAVGLVL